MKAIATLKLGVFGLLALFAVAVAQPQKAAAHYVYNAGHTYYSSEDCVWARSEVSHGNGNGYSKSDIESRFRAPAGGSYCGDWFNRPPGYMKIRQLFEGQLAPGWGICKDTGWVYNGSSTSTLTVARTHSDKCGYPPTNFRTESQGWMLNGSWKGGTLFSGNHWF